MSEQFVPFCIQPQRIEGVITEEDREMVASKRTVKDYIRLIRILNKHKEIDFVLSERLLPKSSEASTPERVKLLVLPEKGGIVEGDYINTDMEKADWKS